MPKRDGSIVFETKLDNKKLDKELNAVNAKIRKLKDNVENLKAQRMPLAEQMKAYGTRLDDARRKLEALKAEQARVNEILNPSNPANHVAYDEYINAYMRKDSINADVKRQQEEVDKLSKEWENAGKKVKDYDQKIKQATNNLNSATAQAGELSKKQAQAADGGKKLREETEKARKSMDKTSGTLGKVLKRIGGVAASAFIFSVAYRGFNALSKYLGNMITTNERFSKSLEVIKGNLLTAFQPIFEAVLPALEWLLDVVTDVTRGIAQFVAVLFGKDVKATAEAAKNQYEMAGAIEETGDAAKQAAKQLLPFDELNILETNASVDTSGVTEGAEEIGASFELIEDAETESWVDTLTNSNFGKGFVQFWEKMKEILSGTFATIWDGVVSAFNWFWEILEDADPDVIEAVLGGIVTALGIWISYKAISSVITNTKKALTAFGNAISAHPVAAAASIIGGIVIALGDFLQTKFNNSETGKFIEEMDEIRESAEAARTSIEDLMEETKMSETQAEQDYAGISVIADKYFELSQKSTLTDADKQMLQVYYEQLEEYAPGMITNIDEITKAWKGTKEELKNVINQQKLVNLQQTYGQFLAEAEAHFGRSEYELGNLNNAIEEVRQKLIDIVKSDEGTIWYTLNYGINAPSPEELVDQAINDIINNENTIKDKTWLQNLTAFFGNEQANLLNSLESLIKEKQALEDSTADLKNDYLYYNNKYYETYSEIMKQAQKAGEQIGASIINGAFAGAASSANRYQSFVGMKIPGLATGAVIPANREFVARLGDNTTETEVVSPLSTMKQAFKEALAEMGGINTGNYTAVLEVDGKELGRVLLPSLKKEQKRIGTSLVKG